eukprot:521889-Prorocentrum_minimum.AAC.3
MEARRPLSMEARTSGLLSVCLPPPPPISQRNKGAFGSPRVGSIELLRSITRDKESLQKKNETNKPSANQPPGSPVTPRGQRREKKRLATSASQSHVSGDER